MGCGMWTGDVCWKAGDCFGEKGVMIEREQLDAGMYYDSMLGLLASSSSVMRTYGIRMLSRILESGLDI